MGQPLAVPTQFGSRYRLESVLGQGAMATVYLATDLETRNEVAIKIPRPDLVPILGQDRFRREIRIVSQFSHPHIMPLLGSGEVDGLLFYVMPVARGETLRARLNRERQLPLEDAVAIVRDVAEALSYAHAYRDERIVHRDIKPENILLESSGALVADFGIARVADNMADGSLSSTGIAFGTPDYMSPEQASAEVWVDGRSDIYGLGCVFYEMLVGEKVFPGPSALAIANRHRHEKVPSLALARPDLPGWVQGVVEKALAKTAADRYSTGAELIRALEARREPVRRRTSRLLPWLGVGAVLLLAMSPWLRELTQGAGGGTATPRVSTGGLDTSRYVVLPFDRTGDSINPLNVEDLVREGLERWTGLTVVPGFQVHEAVTRLGRTGSSKERRQLAASLGAGRYLHGGITPIHGGIRVDAVLYQTADGAAIRQASSRVSFPTPSDSEVAVLTEQLLLGRADPARRPSSLRATSSLPAFQAFSQGQSALAEWHLGQADSAFSTALQHDPEYADASLWLAQVRVWNLEPRTRWRSEVERAFARRTRLSSVNRDLADALLALSRDDTQRACSVWASMTRRRPSDFAGWYSLATCLRQDGVVVPDRISRSGWRFRSSYHAALNAYQQAFLLLPSIHRGLRDESYDQLQHLLYTNSTDVRSGWAPAPDSARFFAFPSWEGDSIAFVPYPAKEVVAGRVTAPANAVREAVIHQRRLFYEIATGWLAAYPVSPDALEAVAVALETMGDPSAIDTLRRARSLAVDPGQRSRVAAREVWLRFKLAFPDNIREFREARSLADSLLSGAGTRTLGDARALAALAALTGRAQLAADLSALSPSSGFADLPAHLRKSSLALLTFASMGGPPDSLRTLEDRVEAAISSTTSADEREARRLELLGRPASLVFPDFTFRAVSALSGHGDPLIDAQGHVLLGQQPAALAALATFRKQTGEWAASDLTVDALYPWAKLAAAVGAPAVAAELLDLTLGALKQMPTLILSYEGRPGMLALTMAFRAELADRLGDRQAARKWAQLAAVLWSGADPFLQPRVRRMTELAE